MRRRDQQRGFVERHDRLARLHDLGESGSDHARNRTATMRSPTRVDYVARACSPAHTSTPTATSPRSIMAGSGFTQTFRELDAAANRLSRLLRAAGLQPGDHIAMCMENHDRYLEIVWGCHYAGLVYTCASSRLTSHELEYIVNDCGARAYITSKYKADQAAEIVGTTPNVELRLMLDGTIDGYESYETAVAEQSPEPLDEARVAGLDMLYSSGTTGMPKGITRAFPNEPLDAAPGAVQGLLQLLFGMDDSKRYLSPAPFYHAAPLRFCLATHGIGATIVAMEHFDAEEYLRSSTSTTSPTARWCRRCSCACSSCPRRPATKYDVSSLESVIHAAAPCPVPVKQQMIEWFGPVIHEYYAGSEGNGFVYCNSEGWLAHPGTVGSADQLRAAHRRRGRRRGPAGRVGHRLLRGRRRVRVPQRPGEDGGVAPPEGLDHARRRRLRRRRRLLVPHRPQGVHDHLRRREHLPAGGRERPGHPSRR